MQSERPSSLSSWPSLSAYVHDHQSVVVRSCSDEPTTRSESDSDHQYQQQQRRRECEQEAENENEGNSGVGFEFSFYCAEAAMSSPISADQIFHNGRIKPTVPIYEVARVYPEQEDRKSSTEVDDPRLKVAVEKMTIQKTSRRKALRRLFMEEKEKHSSPAPFISASTSSSETDEATSELESVPSDTYCVWKPKTSSDSNPNEICKKSEPLSKRWKLKDLLTRNSSNEKDSQSQSQTLSSSNDSNKNENEVRMEPQLARKMAMKEGGERRKSYLPYRQELVGIFGSSGR